jgi:hypothetical protein
MIKGEAAETDFKEDRTILMSTWEDKVRSKIRPRITSLGTEIRAGHFTNASRIRYRLS